jgi:hypothetical protein
MAIKPTKPTVPPAPSRSNPGVDFSNKADVFAAFQSPFADYMDEIADFVDEMADDALAAATGGDLPPLTGQAGKVLAVKGDESGAEFIPMGQFPDGTAAAPSITNTGDTNTGVFFPAADTVAVATGGTERARIDSDGNLLIGTTSGSGAGEIMNLAGNVNSHLVRMSNSNASPYGPDIFYSVVVPNNTTNEFIQCRDTGLGPGTIRMTVRSNGGIANYSSNNVNLSDSREKANFSPAGEYLSKICAIPVQTFNYIDQNMDEDPGLTLGVVAQDVQAVAPELVMESNWGTKDDPKMRLSIYQTDLQYALMKAIQEQQALITALTARVAALEA